MAKTLFPLACSLGPLCLFGGLVYHLQTVVVQLVILNNSVEALEMNSIGHKLFKYIRYVFEKSLVFEI